MSPAISVIIPAHNCETKIHRSILSLANQDFPDFEIIVVENGSKDKTYKVATEILKQHFGSRSKFSVYSLKKSDVSEARNFGLEVARGEFIFFLDADDSVAPNTLGGLYRAAINTSADLVFCAFDRVKRRKIIRFERLYKVKNGACFEPLDFIKRFLEGSVWICMGNSLLKTRLIRENNVSFPSELFAGEDQYFLLKYLLFAKRIVFTKEGRLFYYDESSDTLANSTRVFEAVMAYERFLDEWDNKLHEISFKREMEDFEKIRSLVISFKIPYLYIRGMYRIAKVMNFSEFLGWREKVLRELGKVNFSRCPHTRLGRLTSIGTKMLKFSPFLFYAISKFLL